MELKSLNLGILFVFSCSMILFSALQSDFSTANMLSNETQNAEISNSSIMLKKLFFKDGDAYFEILVCRANTRKYAVKAYIECIDENSKKTKNHVSTFYARKDGCYNFNFSVNYKENILNNNCSLIVEGLGILMQEEIERYDINAEIFEIVRNGDFLETTLKIENNEFEDKNLIARGKLFSEQREIDVSEKEFSLKGNSEVLVVLRNILSLEAEHLSVEILKENIAVFEEISDISSFAKDLNLQLQENDTNDAAGIKSLNNSAENNFYQEENSKKIETEKMNFSANKNSAQDLNKTCVQKTSCSCRDYQRLVALYTFLFLSVMLNIILIAKR
ncbi:MAG: hypothetical protein ACP5OZ_03970 [Candidatus Woesearchaeota archaeon]